MTMPRIINPTMVMTLIEAFVHNMKVSNTSQAGRRRGLPNQNSHSPKARVPRKLMHMTTKRQIAIHAPFCSGCQTVSVGQGVALAFIVSFQSRLKDEHEERNRTLETYS